VREISDLSVLAVEGPDGAGKFEVCVVTSEFLGPIKNGGIATATSALIDQLVADGHGVTVIYTLVERGTPHVAQRDWNHWVREFAERGVRLEFIPHPGDYQDWRQKSWLVKEMLATRDFDLVYFNEHHGSGYYALAAKRAGLSPFSEQLHCVITHGSVEWVFKTNDQYVRSPGDLEMMSFERRCVEWADIVIGPSRYLLHEYEGYGWSLPTQTYHQPYPLLRKTAPDDGARLPIDELVFFGRLETRKGLWIFCEALDRIADQLTGKTVTFMGRMTDFSGTSTGALIIARSRKWPFRVRLLTDFDQERALAYLRNPGRLAVMPSLADNSPCVIYECIENGIPFVTSSGSGADELVDTELWADIMVEPHAAALSERLSRLLTDGARLGRPRFDPHKNLKAWSDWHRLVAGDRWRMIAHGPLAWSHPASGPLPLVVVVDDGASPVGLLVDCLTAHVRNIGSLANILVLSPRKGPLRALLEARISWEELPREDMVAIMGTDASEDARRALLAADVLFFVDAEFELLVPFVLTALNLLVGGHAVAVSCVNAIRRAETDEVEIVQLPHGDALAVSGLGRSLGSSAWGVSARRLQDDLKTLEIYDDQRDEFVSAASLGHALAHGAIQRNEPFLLLPVVGAVSVWPGRQPASRTRMYPEAVAVAERLGLAPSLALGGAAWFAISAFGTYSPLQELPPVRGTGALASGHPLLEAQPKHLSEFAAAIGRIELATQLGLSEGKSAPGSKALAEVTKRSIRGRRPLDLSAMLVANDVIGAVPVAQPDSPGALRDRLAALVRGEPAGAPEPRQGELQAPSASVKGEEKVSRVRAYVTDPSVVIDRGKITFRQADQLQIERPILFFVDVPVAGHRAVTAKLSSSTQGELFAQMLLIDQSSGLETGRSQEVAPASDGTLEMSIELGGVFELITLAFAFRHRPKNIQAATAACMFQSIRVR
jgi:glycosyltransferase involved in cell wall biosynthesis